MKTEDMIRLIDHIFRDNCLFNILLVTLKSEEILCENFCTQNMTFYLI